MQINPGDTAWVLTATALVLFMTLPGLALFYAGLVRVKNTLSVIAIRCYVLVRLVFVHILNLKSIIIYSLNLTFCLY